MKRVTALAACGMWLPWSRRGVNGGRPGGWEVQDRGGSRASVEDWGRRLATSSQIKDGVYEAVVALLAIERLVPQHVRLSFHPRG